MSTSNSNYIVARAHAMALIYYLGKYPEMHISCTFSSVLCRVVLFADSLCEVVSLESEIRPFLPDGAAFHRDYLESSDCYDLEVHYLD